MARRLRCCPVVEHNWELMASQQRTGVGWLEAALEKIRIEWRRAG